ncbi:Tn3 family transposase [Streptomyces sp. TE4109]
MRWQRAIPSVTWRWPRYLVLDQPARSGHCWTSVWHGKAGGIAYHHISDTCIALFTHFIPCGVWEAVYIIEGLLKNTSEVKPTTVHADFGEAGRSVIDWDPIESRFRHLMRVAVSMHGGAISSSTLLKRLRSGSHKNSTYTAFREVGRQLLAEGWQVDPEDLAHISPCLTEHIKRFGEHSAHELGLQPEAYDPKLDVDLTQLRDQDLRAEGFRTAA